MIVAGSNLLDIATKTDLPASEVIRLLTYGEWAYVKDQNDWFRPYYYDLKNNKWYLDRDDVSSYIETINKLKPSYELNPKVLVVNYDEALGSN